MKYSILFAEGENPIHEMHEAVNALIAEGWRPQGGVSMIDAPEYFGVMQAMVKDESEGT